MNVVFEGVHAHSPFVCEGHELRLQSMHEDSLGAAWRHEEILGITMPRPVKRLSCTGMVTNSKVHKHTSTSILYLRREAAGLWRQQVQVKKAGFCQETHSQRSASI